MPAFCALAQHAALADVAATLESGESVVFRGRVFARHVCRVPT